MLWWHVRNKIYQTHFEVYFSLCCSEPNSFYTVTSCSGLFFHFRRQITTNQNGLKSSCYTITSCPGLFFDFPRQIKNQNGLKMTSIMVLEADLTLESITPSVNAPLVWQNSNFKLWVLKEVYLHEFLFDTVNLST